MPHFSAGASIINTSSVQAYDPSENLLDYAQTKAAIVSFTKSLAKQLGEKGIRVNAVAPGPVWTPLQVTGGQPPSALEKFGAYTPMGRPGQPAELAAVYVTLASHESSYATPVKSMAHRAVAGILKPAESMNIGYFVRRRVSYGYGH